jgi:hypothetical protein
MEYQVRFVSEFVVDPGSGTDVELPVVTGVIQRMAADGWEPISIVPGTNAQTHSGLFVTFRRGERSAL